MEKETKLKVHGKLGGIRGDLGNTLECLRMSEYT